MKNKSNFSSMLESDFYKLFRLKSVFICPIFMFFMILLNFGMYWWLNKITASVPGGIQELSTKTMLLASSGNANITLFIAIICSLFVGSEFSHGIIKNNIARGSNRVNIYFSKFITLSVLVIIYTLGAFLVSGIFTAISGAIPSVSTGYGAFTLKDLGIIFRTLFLQIILNISVMSIFLMIAFLLRTSGASIGVNLAVYFLSSFAIGLIFAVASRIEWLGEAILYTPNIIANTIVTTANFDVATWMRTIFMPLAYLTVATVIGLSTFIKRDIK